MARVTPAIPLLLLLPILSGCHGGGAAPAPAPERSGSASGPTLAAPPDGRAGDPTTLDGIYTAEQAERGRGLYRRICSECHTTDDWTDPAFLHRWSNESVFLLWYYINDRMPYDNPWTLTRQQVTDALTFILQLNRLPAGSHELATDDDSIDDYWIVWAEN